MTNLRTAKYDMQSLQIDDPNMIRQNVVFEPVTQILSQDGVDIATGNGGVSLALLQNLLQQTINYCVDRRNHTFTAPASSLVLANGQTQQQFDDAVQLALSQLGTTAPSNTAQPGVFTGTLQVNQTLTAPNPPGTWSGSPTKYNYRVWRFKNGTFTDTGYFVNDLAAATPFTYLTQPADATYQLAYTAAGTNAAGVTSAPVFSALTTAIGVTLPSNTVAPVITSPGTTFPQTFTKSSDGTWINNSGGVFSYQWRANGVDIPLANYGTPYTAVAGQETATITLAVFSTTSQGTSAAPGVSNGITMTGSPSITFTSQPAFPSTLQENVLATITDAGMTISGGGTPIFISTEIFCVEGSGGLNTNYVIITDHTQQYNPVNDSYFQTKTGLLTGIAGKNMRVRQTWALNGTNYTTNLSAASNKTVTAASVAFSVATTTSNILSTQNTQISAVKPLTPGGGVLPYTFLDYTPNIALLGYAVASDGTISGTPTVVQNQITVTGRYRDGAGTIANNTFTLSVIASSSVQTVVSINAKDPFNTMNGYLQLLGGSQNLATVNETTGIVGTGTIIIAGSPSAMRFGKINDPLDATRKVFVGASKNTDPATFGHVGRCEVGPSTGVASLNKSGTTYWFAYELNVTSSKFAAGAGNLFQIHQSDPTVDPFGPFALAFYNAGRVATNACVAIVYAPGSDAFIFPYYSNNGFTTGTGVLVGNYPVDTNVKWVFKYRGDPIGNTGLLQAWMNGLLVVSLNNIRIGLNTPNYPNDYPKFLYDDFVSGGGSAGAYALARSWHMVLDNGSYTEPQIRALLV